MVPLTVAMMGGPSVLNTMMSAAMTDEEPTDEEPSEEDAPPMQEEDEQ